MDDVKSLNEFYEGGPTNIQEAFPPICISSHWDPTQMSKHILPQQLAAPLQEDPRQAVRICTSYYSLARQDYARTNPPAPLQFGVPPGGAAAPVNTGDKTLLTPPQLLGPSYYKRPEEGHIAAIPPGGAAGLGAPYTLYADAINEESDLWRLNEPLTRCKELRYKPGPQVPTDSTNTLPHVSQKFGLSPHATYVSETAGCREADDEAAWNRSGRLFFNHTRLDRVYPKTHGPLACGTKVL